MANDRLFRVLPISSQSLLILSSSLSLYLALLLLLGVIRVGDRLEGLRVNRPYTFQVIAEDCHRPIPLRAWVDVQVGLLKQGCQQGWEGKWFNYLFKPAPFRLFSFCFYLPLK